MLGETAAKGVVEVKGCRSGKEIQQQRAPNETPFGVLKKIKSRDFWCTSPRLSKQHSAEDMRGSPSFAHTKSPIALATLYGPRSSEGGKNI